MMDGAKFFKAAAEGAIEQMKILLEAGGDINMPDKGGITALHLASQEGRLGAVKWLLENGAKPNVRTESVPGDRQGCYPIHEAAMSGHLEIIKLLVSYKAKINVKASDGFTPLMCAVERGDVEMTEWLIANKAELDLKGTEGTAVHIAVEHPAVLRLLLDAGADIEVEIPYLKMTPLMNAGFCRNEESVKMLLIEGADPNRIDADQQTALHSSVIAWGRRETEMDTMACVNNVKTLLSSGVNRHLKDKHGRTALDYARRFGAREIKTLLEAENC